MKLDLAKCAFGITSDKFLRFMVLHQEIKANPKKTQAIRQMEAPKTVKVQRFTLLSKSAERCLPFFQILKKPKDFRWIDECQRAFEESRHISVHPVAQ